MNLRQILEYENVTIQCHDNPDADALAAGYALYTFLQENGRKASLIYSGKLKIQKDNLILMVNSLEIPIEYREDNTEKIDGLLITVDCQYGAKNVTKFLADDIMIIDHHQYEIEGIEKTYIVSNMGSCSTVVWKLLNEADFDFSKYPKLQTALYYGLYTDTGQFADLSNPVDRDMQDALKYDSELIHTLQNSNISARELEIAGVSMIRAIINKELRFAVVKAEPCDPNILGLISDFVLQVSEIDVCVVFNVLDHGIKFSVRSSVKEVKADHVARMISKGIGSGGGHKYKAGGYIGNKDYEDNYGEYDHVSYFSNAMKQYLEGYRIIDTDVEEFDTEGSERYCKKSFRLGYVKASDILPVGAETTVRTLEGDLRITIKEDTHIMIGIKGEIYPISGENFRKNYEPLEDKYDMELPYHPKAKLMDTGKEYYLLDYAKSCMSMSQNEIFAKPLEKGVKIFTAWDKDDYMLGEPGDYIAAKCDNLHDMYVIAKDIFGMTYEKK